MYIVCIFIQFILFVPFSKILVNSYFFMLYFSVHTKDLTLVDNANSEWCSSKFFDTNICRKTIGLLLEKKAVSPFLQKIIPIISRNCTHVPTWITSLKEINNRTLVSDSFELSLRCYWWIKLHSSTPNISISTLLKILLTL